MTVPADKASKGVVTMRPACAECQRRKQRCDREWPCYHCHKRKIGDQCNYKLDAEPNSAWTASADVKRKRDSEHDDDDDDDLNPADFESIGYTTSHLLANLDISGPSKEPEEFRAHATRNDALRRALEILPPRKTIDSLVQNFLENVNYYYYIVYPPNFVREYATWWKDRDNDEPMGLPWTCLLIMICACSIQHTDAAMAAQLEAELGAPVKELTDRYHNASRELHSAIPVGLNHLFSVQYQLHSCYWFKAEARFVECWQILGATVREAQALGLHLEPEAPMSDFKREMRARLWCIVDSWDWLVSCLLARPMLIDRSDSTVSLPNLTLEGFPVSPLLHLKLQSELVGIIFKRFGPPRILTDPADIREYQEILEAFMGTFPPAYAFENPDTDPEQTHPWVALHRHYMHTCTLSITLGAFRPYMAKNMTKKSPETELEFRRHGISYALRLLQAVQRFFEYVWARDSTFHFVPFCIFDTAALLCSALLHDKDNSIPQREEITSAIQLALSTLKRLRSATETAKAPYDVLRRLVKKVWGPMSSMLEDNQNKRHKGNNPSPTPPPITTRPVSNQPIRISPADPRTIVHPQAPVSSVGTHNEQPVLFPSPPSSAGLPGSAHCEQQAMFSSPPSSVGLQAVTTAMHNVGDQFVLNSGGPYEAHSPHWPQGYQQYPAGPMPAVSNTPMVPTHGAMSMPEEEVRQMLGNVQPVPLDHQPMGQEVFPNAQLGDLAQLWNWQSLDLGFASNPIMYQQ